MAKKSMPMPTGGGILPKVVGLVVALAVGSLVIQHPSQSAGWVNRVFGWLVQAIDGVSTFLQHLLG